MYVSIWVFIFIFKYFLTFHSLHAQKLDFIVGFGFLWLKIQLTQIGLFSTPVRITDLQQGATSMPA